MKTSAHGSLESERFLARTARKWEGRKRRLKKGWLCRRSRVFEFSPELYAFPLSTPLSCRHSWLAFPRAGFLTPRYRARIDTSAKKRNIFIFPRYDTSRWLFEGYQGLIYVIGYQRERREKDRMKIEWKVSRITIALYNYNTSSKLSLVALLLSRQNTLIISFHPTDIIFFYLAFF